MKRRVIYMGTPEFAIPPLEALAASDRCEVPLVVTQPDRAAGRGKKLQSPPVRTAAEALGLPVLQTGTLRDEGVRRRIIDLQPDLIVVAAFGMILGRWILELPEHGCVNLHASLLPRYRGANPIAAAIAMGEAKTGVTLMRMDRGLDTGDMYASRSVPIASDDTTESLTPKLARVAASLLLEHLVALLDGSAVASPQPPGATVTRQMTKADGWLDWQRSADDLERNVRAMWPWPRAWTATESGDRIQVHRSRPVPDELLRPGTVRNDDEGVLVGCGSGALELLRVQLPGGKPLEGHALRQARPLRDGAVLGERDGPGEVPPLVLPAEG